MTIRIRDQKFMDSAQVAMHATLNNGRELKVYMTGTQKNGSDRMLHVMDADTPLTLGCKPLFQARGTRAGWQEVEEFIYRQSL